jgi:hypothetical protein
MRERTDGLPLTHGQEARRRAWEDRTAALLFGAKRFMILTILTL